MAQPTRRDYLIVSVALLVLSLGGGWLAVNWRRLAAAYYIHRAENLQADPATVRAALAKAGELDRRQLVAFWERELAALNRAEAKRSPPPTDGPYLTLAAGRRVFEAGEEVRLAVTFNNPTEHEEQLPGFIDCRCYRHDVADWAAARRRPEKWNQEHCGRGYVLPGGEPPGKKTFLSPHQQSRGEVICTFARVTGWTNTSRRLSDGEPIIEDWALPGLYCLEVPWGKSPPAGQELTVRGFYRVLPKPGAEAEEDWSPPPSPGDN